MSNSSTGTIRRFQDLIAWKLAYRITVQVHRVTEHFPSSELHGITSQIRRSANSIAANIAEGFGRHSPREYLRALFYARGSLAETESHLEVAYAVGFLSRDEFDQLQSLCFEARKVTQGLIRHIRSTVDGFPGGITAEGRSDYIVDSLELDSELSTNNSEPGALNSEL